jgi:hypothetical protein
MFHAETIVTKASADEDYRLQLMAIDRVRAALELTMKAIGQIGGDGAVVVNVDARTQVAQMFESLPETTWRALQNGCCPNCQQALVADAVQPALRASENGTPLRD